MSRLVRTLILAGIAFCLAIPSASATSTSRLASTLGEMWTTVLETPMPQNPFAGGDPCVPLDHHVVAPIARGGVDSCTVKSGTKIFVAAWTNECSTFEGNGTTEAGLRACAVRADADITSTPTVAVDAQSVPVTEVQTGLLSIRLPRDNFFAEKAADRNGLSVAHGWVVLLQPLAAGKHRIHIYVQGHADVTTKIIVT